MVNFNIGGRCKIRKCNKNQLNLSKITDSKKVPNNITKLLNLLPNPFNWWRAITK